MTNLRKKILILLISILSLFSIILFCIYNAGAYNRESNNIKDKFIRFASNNIKINRLPDIDKNPVFLNDEIYEVEFYPNGKIYRIENFSNGQLSKKEIIDLIEENIDDIKKESINNLYTNDYSFFINKENKLIIMNITPTKNYLLYSLYTSIALFFVFELLIIYLSFIITKWIVIPVENSFTKQKQFISDASHELKTPLAIISASAETIEINENDRKYLDNIKEETSRMNYLVTNLLELSRTENIKEKENYIDTNLSKLVLKKSLSFESLMFENDLKLETNIDDNITFRCSDEKINELISILIDNAIKYADKNSTINIKLKKNKNIIELSVTNQGVEIPLTDREKIFERFYIVDKSRTRNNKNNSYGLGLSIAKNIVTNHGGKISVSCNEGYTTFKVLLK